MTDIRADKEAGTPERIWVNWKGANAMYQAFDEPPTSEFQDGQTEWVRADIHTSACLDALAAMGQAGEHLDTIAALTARAEHAEAALVAQVAETERAVARAERLRAAMEVVRKDCIGRMPLSHDGRTVPIGAGAWRILCAAIAADTKEAYK